MSNKDRTIMIQRRTPESAAMVANTQRAMAITPILNRLTYADGDEIRRVFSDLIGRQVDDSFTLIPPFYTAHGVDIRVGRNVFINQNCTIYDLGGVDIGDLSGIEASYAAYQLYQAKHGKAPVIGGLTGDQRFFLAYAQAWQAKLRDGLQRQLLLSDPHSPAKFRVNGIVRNFDPWYKAFDIKPGDALYLAPEKRVHIW